MKDTHINHYAGKPLHDSDRVVTETMRDKSGGQHEVTHCKHCGAKMTRPIREAAQL